MDYFRIVLDLVCGLLGLLILTKILGKTQITQITPFDFISALVLGELVGNAVFDDKIGVLQILFAVTIWGVLIYIIEVITQKIAITRPYLEGKPAIIIHKGQIIKEKLKKNKLDINQLQHLLRSKNVFSIREVEYAILETDGSISVLKKSSYEQPTRQDYNMEEKKVRLPITLISDGQIINENLKESGFTEEWLISELRSKGVNSYKDLLIAEWLEEDGLYIQTY
ncbi:YetF domain-containing protein [Fredinandcohnia sp. 179-A 10B2 NHS]|uniref:YetF domain-containing protein n=1 Tax=Fredinandcohnia sp. 179-A 10B2 NHS TaxID=3235176 RepID=UPI00399F899D